MTSRTENEEDAPEGSEEEPSGPPDRDMDGRVHISRLKLMAKSEAHYRANPRKDSKSFATGRAAHSYLLGDRSKIVVYEGVRNKKHKKYQEFLEQHPGATIVSPREMWDVKGMAMALERCPAAMRLLEGNREQYMQWEMRGHRCAGTPDVWREDGSVTELKTDDCTEPEAFLRSAERYHYHAQLTWYRAGLLASGKVDRSGPLHIVAVESSAPYCVTIVHLDVDTCGEGQRLWQGWLDRLARAEMFDEWPGYKNDRVTWSPRQQRLAL